MKRAIAALTLAAAVALPATAPAQPLQPCFAPYFSFYINGVPYCVRWWQPNSPCNFATELFVDMVDTGDVCVKR